MSNKRYVNEGSTSYHGLTFVGPNGESVVPEALRYKVMTGKGDILIPWATVPPGTTELEVSAENNTIGTLGTVRYVTVEATHNAGDKITSEIVYTLTNLKGI